jgi:hypothetical protein
MRTISSGRGKCGSQEQLGKSMDEKLAEVLGHAQEYLNCAVHAKEKDERECYKRIVELYLSIAHELEGMSDRIRSSKCASN